MLELTYEHIAHLAQIDDLCSQIGRLRHELAQDHTTEKHCLADFKFSSTRSDPFGQRCDIVVSVPQELIKAEITRMIKVKTEELAVLGVKLPGPAQPELQGLTHTHTVIDEQCDDQTAADYDALITQMQTFGVLMAPAMSLEDQLVATPEGDRGVTFVDGTLNVSALTLDPLSMSWKEVIAAHPFIDIADYPTGLIYDGHKDDESRAKAANLMRAHNPDKR